MVLRQCAQKGTVKGKRQAMDSVHVKANTSMRSLKEKQIIDDGATYEALLKRRRKIVRTKTRSFPLPNTRKRRGTTSGRTILMSSQEKKLLSLLSQGKESKAIAAELNLSTHTVDTHRRNLLQKTNCVDTTALVTYARTAGFL